MAAVAPAATKVLRTVIFMGSARDITPPWGGDSRLGSRVLNWVTSMVQSRSTDLAGVTLTHQVTVYDPLEVFGADGALSSSGGELRTPHFFIKSGESPAAMDQMAQTLRDADCYLIVAPEYNHSIPPALSSMMGHFGGSCYAEKPSGIVTYSSGPFGGARGAVALRPFLSELGCLPVSKMACFPFPDQYLNPDGTVSDPNNRMLKQLPDLLSQLEWWAMAASNQREAVAKSSA